MKNQITELVNLKKGEKYLIHCKPFDTTNKVVFICGDITDLKRDIAYFQYAERDNKIYTESVFKKLIQKESDMDPFFCLWGTDLQFNTITELN